MMASSLELAAVAIVNEMRAAEQARGKRIKTTFGDPKNGAEIPNSMMIDVGLLRRLEGELVSNGLIADIGDTGAS